MKRFAPLALVACGARTELPAPEPPRVDALAAGDAHTCALLEGGEVWCWGGFQEVAKLRPVPVDLPGPASALAAGGSGTCAIVGGDVLCWGYATLGQLGPGTPGWTEGVVTIQGIGGPARELALGNAFACAVLEEGSLVCWGANGSAQLGHGTAGDEEPPGPALIPGPITRPALGVSHSCALRAELHEANCWGNNNFGELGRGFAGEPEPAPGPIAPSWWVLEVVAGWDHGCALEGEQPTERRVRCWGNGFRGQLGTGTADSLTPLLVPLGPGARHVSTTLDHVCAVSADSRAVCWGTNVSGQVGDGTLGEIAHPDPNVVPDVQDVELVAAGADHSCAATALGRVFCWGEGSAGQLGDGNDTGSPHPVEVAPFALE